MDKYRKKPVIIEAVQFDGLNPTEIKDFVGENCEVEIYDNKVTPPIARIIIHTLEGDMEVSKGDFVIKGVKGEFYPCKPDIFEQTYESVENQDSLALEEAAEEFYDNTFDELGGFAETRNGSYDVFFPSNAIRDAFIAGANWYKEQMMKGAVEETVENGVYISGIDCSRLGLKLGDKVKLIVVKED